jgi:TolA-binding protein
MKHLILSFLLAGTTFAAPASAPAGNPELAALIEQLQRKAAAASEADMLKLLELGRNAGAPFQVAPIVKAYLGQNPRPPAKVLLLAAENAWLTADFRTAASRYKAYLLATEPSADAAAAAAQLCRIQIDYLGDKEDAYRFLRENGEKYRQHAGIRRLDTWFLAEARQRKDCAAAGRLLVTAFGEKQPLEQERYYYGESLDWLMAELPASKDPGDAPATLRKLGSLIRGDAGRAAAATFVGAFLELRAGQAADAGPVVAAGRAWLDAKPEPATVQRMFGLLAAVEAEWSRQVEAKRELFVAAFGKLNDEQRGETLRWAGNLKHLLTPVQWAELAAKHPVPFQMPANTVAISFALPNADANAIRKQAALVKGVANRSAAVYRAAVASDDFGVCWQTLVREDAWHLPAQQMGNIVASELWPTYKVVQAAHQTRTSDAYYQQTVAKLGAELLAGSPVAVLDAGSIKSYLEQLWRQTPGLDKSAFIAGLQALNWVPWSERDRRWVVEGLAGAVRGHEAALKNSKDEKAAAAKAQLPALTEAFTRALNGPADTAKAPNPLCRGLAQLLWAGQQGQVTNYLAAARTVYPLVRDYDVKKTPYGASVLEYILATPRNVRGTAAFHAEVIADQAAQLDLTRWQPRFEQVINAMGTGREEYRSLSNLPNYLEAEGAQYNTAFGKVLVALADRKQFSPAVYELFRQTRGGRNWQVPDLGAAVVEKLITSKVLLQTPARPNANLRSGAVSYMWMAAECPPLAAKYPVATAFDNLFAEEAITTGFLDGAYWQWGRDTGRKIANVAAKVLARYETAPLGYDDRPAYSREALADWHERAWAADKAEREALVAALDARAGKTRFDEAALGRGWFAVHGASAPRAEVFAQLAAFANRADSLPTRATVPRLNLKRVASPDNLTDAELATLRRLLTETPAPNWAWCPGSDELASLASAALLSRKRAPELLAVVPELWRIARQANNNNLWRALAQMAEATLKDNGDIAAAFAAAGLEVFAGDLPADMRASLTAVKSQAMMAMGGAIPVDRNDPRFPIFASQAAFNAGNLQNAWDLYAGASDRVATMVRELDPKYVIWLINQNAKQQLFEQAEALAKQLVPWLESVGAAVDADTRGRLLLAYANIAFERREYPKARALFERIVTAPEFAEARVKEDAELRIAEADRLGKQYDKAFELLDRLTRRKDRAIQTEAFFQLARLKFDQEEYQDARRFLDQVFLRAPDHAEARILEGNLDLKMKRLIEATEVKVGLTTSQRVIVPGKPLKVRLEDQNLATVGKADSIEIRAWTESGDEETFTLVPSGDSKTKFEGSITTELAPTGKGDKVLQILGEDTIRYDFSDRFKKAHNITSQPFVLTVATDSELYASSGKILTKEELAERQLEEMLRAKLQMAQPEEAKATLSLTRPPDQIKPGNKINVRVIDPDRSTTPQRDRVRVSVRAASGDVINGFELTETDTHSGVFEGQVPTASAQALAVASNSEEGKLPSFPISAGNHPAWVALTDNLRPKLYTVDLHDNVLLGKLNVRADVVGRRLKRFSVQTSLNGRDFTPLASWPAAHEPWDGALRLAIVKADPKKLPATPTALREYFQVGCLEQGSRPVQTQPKALAFAVEELLAPKAAQLKLGATDTYIAHLRGAFYLDTRKVRTFRLKTRGHPQSQYRMFINGIQANPPQDEAGRAIAAGSLELRKPFAKGVHVLDVYIISTPQAGAKVDLQWDIEAEPYMATCSADVFDIAKYPQIKQEVLVPAATVTPGKDNAEFDIAFAANARARMVRLVLEDFEGDAPALSRLTLTDAAGKQVLPTQQDLTKLKENQTLEIIPGDKITLAYEDPKTVSPGRNSHQAHLAATYMNATINACFAEVEGEGVRRRTGYVPVRRFTAGEPIAVVISDPDRDTTEKADTVKFTAKTTDGKPVTVEAFETAEHSGVFVGNVFPVKTEPQRATELKVRDADDVMFAYLDEENMDPGVPWARTVSIEQAMYTAPQLRIYDVTSRALVEAGEDTSTGKQGKSAATATAKGPERGEEVFPATRALLAVRPKTPADEKPASALLDGPVFVEVLFPTIALSRQSKTAVYVQTAAGRAKHGKPIEGTFDINVPGTIKLTSGPGDVSSGQPPAGYRELTVKGDREASSPLDDGRFAFRVPIKLGEPQAESLAKDVEVKRTEPPMLMVKGGDEIFVGYEFKDADGQTRWLTGRVILGSDYFLDVMDRKYQAELTGAHVGENVYLRVMDKSKHVSADKDKLTATVTTSSGKSKTVELTETFGDTGIFKGYLILQHAQDQVNTNDAAILPVMYGDTIAVSYKTRDSAAPVQRQVLVFKGADGDVLPFTKRFKDPEIAVQTQFTIAESLFELAKKHRELGEESLARREIGQGKKVLEEVLRDYPDTKSKAQADYLLANLSLEFANIAVDEDAKRKQYIEAVGRFTDIVASYPDSQYAPKAQFKKALTFEKMGEIDQACEEYVKLSYRYPDNELVAETIARLGQYFFTKAKLVNEKIAAEKDKLAQEKLKMEARNMFTTAAEVFGRLAVRFPAHSLASKSIVMSGQCYMRAEDYGTAVKVFRVVTEDANADKEARAEGMYWCGDAYLKMSAGGRGGPTMAYDPVVEAYRMFKRLTWDYPESKWAKFSRGRLTEPALATAARGEER